MTTEWMGLQLVDWQKGEATECQGGLHGDWAGMETEWMVVGGRQQDVKVEGDDVDNRAFLLKKKWL